MPTVDNLTPEGITLMRWRSLPNSCVWVDPRGRQMRDVPAHIAYSDLAKSLANQGSLRIEGYSPPGSEPVVHTPHEAVTNGTVSGERRDKRTRRQER